MNDSSRNLSYLDDWYACLDQGYVEPRVYQCFQVLCFLLGTPALVWCLLISLSGSLSGDLKPTLVFTINLFAVELIICVESLLEVVSYLFRQNVILQQAVYASYILSWTCRPLFQSCICVERLLAVAQPVAFLKYRLRRYRVVCSTVIWFFLFINAIYIALVDDFGLNMYVFVSVYCLGVVIITLCCFSILRVLKQPGPGEVEGSRGGEKKQGTTDPQKRRAFGIILTNLVIIVLSSLTVVLGYVATSSIFSYYCNAIPILLIVSIFSVMISPLLHLHREGRLPCRSGRKTR